MEQETLTREEAIKQARALKVNADIEAARHNLYRYNRLIHPSFYTADKPYLKEICDDIQEFMEQDEIQILVLNMPPRHGKSFTGEGTTEWLFGLDPTLKVMTGSYNETLSTTFARAVRDTISTKKVGDQPVYSDVFPNTRVKYGQSSVSLWALAGSQQENYLATSPTGTATGFGANVLVIDDVIKNAEEAFNERVLENHWSWFSNTMMQRLEGRWKIIIIMTRWATNDLAGRVLEAFPNNTKLISYSAVQPDGSMLCDSVLSKEDYEIKTREMSVAIVEANYNQKPIDIQGRLYSDFKQWEHLPEHDSKALNYTDTADKGTDFTCSINYVLIDGVDGKEAYITDLVFTDEPMEITEPAVASLLNRGDVNIATIESNNGGRGFARNVKRILQEKYKTNRTTIATVNQTKNKESRILTSSAWCANHIYMPLNWKHKYPEFYRQLTSYQSKGKNLHDDAPDVLASIYEQATGKMTPKVYNKARTGLYTKANQSSSGGYWR